MTSKQETQERILDVQRKANQSREDVEREFQRDFEDISRELFDAENEVLRQFREGSITSDEATRRIEELQTESAREITEAGRELNRDLEDIGIREGRRVSGVERTSEDREQDIIRQAEQEALALRDILAPLLAGDSTLATQQSETAEIQSVTAAMEAVTAVTTSETATTQAAVAEMEAETAAVYAPTVEMFGTGAETLQTAATLLTEFDLSTLVGAVEQIPFALGSLTETLTELPERLGMVFTETFSQIPGLFAPMVFSALQETPVLSGATPSGASAGGNPSEAGAISVRVTNLDELASVLSEGGADGSRPIVLNVDNSLVLDDGSVSKVEGRMAVRKDSGLSVLDV